MKSSMKSNQAGELYIMKGRKPRKFCRVCAFNLKGETALIKKHYEFMHDELKNPEWLLKD